MPDDTILATENTMSGHGRFIAAIHAASNGMVALTTDVARGGPWNRLPRSRGWIFSKLMSVQ